MITARHKQYSCIGIYTINCWPLAPRLHSLRIRYIILLMSNVHGPAAPVVNQPPTPTANGKGLPSLHKIIVGVLGFISFSVLGLVALNSWREPGELRLLLQAVTPVTIAVMSGLVSLDYVLGGLRYRLFFDGRLFPRVSLWHCIRANWANMFMGAVTPAQTGGGPALIYVLCRRGASLSQAMLVSLLNVIATFLFFAVAGLATAYLLPRGLLPSGAVVAVGVLLTAIAGLVFVLIAAIAANAGALQLMGRLVVRVTTRLPQIRRRVARGGWLSGELLRVRFGVRAVVRHGKLRMALAFLTTVVLYLNKYVIGLALAWALQGATSFSFIGLQLLQNVALYFAPTPGASGLAEASTGVFLTHVLAAEFLVVWTIGWRLSTTFIAAILGFCVTLSEARRHMVRRTAVHPVTGAVRC